MSRLIVPSCRRGARAGPAAGRRVEAGPGAFLQYAHRCSHGLGTAAGRTNTRGLALVRSYKCRSVFRSTCMSRNIMMFELI